MSASRLAALPALLLALSACGSTAVPEQPPATTGATEQATTSTPNSSSAASPGGNATPGAYPYQAVLPVTFKFKTSQGWSYQFTLDEVPVLTPAKDVTSSPPGKAVLTWTLSGQTRGSITSLDTGRDAPIPGRFVSFMYGDKPADFPDTLYNSEMTFDNPVLKAQSSDTAKCFPADFRPITCMELGYIAGDQSFTPVPNDETGYVSDPMVSEEAPEAVIDTSVKALSPAKVARMWLSTGGHVVLPNSCTFFIDVPSGHVTVGPKRYDKLTCALLR